jgi:GTP-binding protein HflX
VHIVKDFHKPEKAFLIGVHHKKYPREECEYSMSELGRLATTAGIIVVDSIIQSLDNPDTSTLIGSGKLKEIIDKCEENDITTLIFNDNLTPSQAKNIAQLSKCNIVDRTELILDIFAKHAKSYESSLQVELAQLEYSYSKLRNLWQHFSRIAGGVGVRGPGEKQIEIDRRNVKDRISLLKDKLLEVKKTTETKRKHRSQHISICLIGYTNAGKSTLFNALTHEKIYVADELFATLDATTRAFDISAYQNHSSHSATQILLTDTIGFIEKLPPTLIQSFYSTLYEVRSADVLLHVVDANHPQKEKMIDVVNKILVDIGAQEKDTILVFNKCDTYNSLFDKFQKKQISIDYNNCIFISAKYNQNINQLKEKIAELLSKRKVKKNYTIPVSQQKVISFLYDNSDIISDDYDPETNSYLFEVYIDKKLLKNLAEQIENARLLDYIDS